MPTQFAAFAACQPGLEPLLCGELQALGAAPTQAPGGAMFAADVAMVMRAGLWLGTASHVLVRLAEFPCRALGELERKARQLPWSDWLRPTVPVAVHGTAKGSRVYHTGAITERVEQAIGAALGRRPAAPASAEVEAARIAVRFRDDHCTISIDTTASPLHRRGYRLATAKAPLREDLAHALLLAGGLQPGMPMLDPFCGSGTLAIEAAGLLAGLPPGRLRPPPLQHLALFEPEAWDRVFRAVPGPRATPPILASDRDAGAITAAGENAARAGVAAAITFQNAAVTKNAWFEAPTAAPAGGLLATNPPFGLRVQGGKLLPLYQTLGHRAAQLPPGWRVALLAYDLRLARRTALPLQAAFTTRHGGLAVTALVGPAAAAPEPAPTPAQA